MDRFYCLFAMLKSSVNLLPTLLPVIEINRTFMKSSHYNGAGEHCYVPIAIAWVPSETKDKFTCFFLNLKPGGVPLPDMQHLVIVVKGKSVGL
jgi:hypothetical protein